MDCGGGRTIESRRVGVVTEIGSHTTGWTDGCGAREIESRRAGWTVGGAGGDKESRRVLTGVYGVGADGCPVEWEPGDLIVLEGELAVVDLGRGMSGGAPNRF